MDSLFIIKLLISKSKQYQCWAFCLYPRGQCRAGTQLPASLCSGPSLLMSLDLCPSSWLMCLASGQEQSEPWSAREEIRLTGARVSTLPYYPTPQLMPNTREKNLKTRTELTACGEGWVGCQGGRRQGRAVFYFCVCVCF